MNTKQNEEMLIIGDYGFSGRRLAPLIAGCYLLAAHKLGLKVRTVMQTTKEGNGDLAKEVCSSLRVVNRKSIIVLLASNKLGLSGSLGKSFRRYSKEKEFRFVTTTGLANLPTETLADFTNTLNVDYLKMQRLGGKISSILAKGRVVRVKTSLGTDIEFNIKAQNPIINDGFYWQPRSGGNIPAGEVYIAPKKEGTNGVIIIDGSSRNKANTLLIKKPIRLKIREGEIVEIVGGREAKLLKASLIWAEKKAKIPSSTRSIGEFGIGLNPNCKLMGTMIVDEKTLGTAHIGIGSNNWFGGTIVSPIHLDQVFKNPEIFVDGKKLELPSKKELI
ncbi:aminopeptidase [Candidatus Woesearchaeota archaeon]|nr:aminopeptidase [Candidatus Woesearchaeota archaeon]